MLNLLRRLLNWLRWLLGLQTQSVSPELPSSPDMPQPPRVQPLTSLAPPPYRKNDSVFTYRERVFYGALLDAVGRGYWTFAKVRIADFIWLPKDALDYKYHHSQILCKHIDFLVCDRRTYRPLLAIELDDPSHRYADSQDRDEFKNRTFATVGLPVLRVTMADAYNVDELQMQIQAALAGAKSEDKTTIM